ncbi:MAG: hypothetical protein ACRDKT_01470 [Actinomycetota bacterium]
MADANVERHMNPVLGTILVVLGFLLHLVAGFFYLVSGLVVPAPWLIILWILWIVLAAYAVRNRHHPWRVLGTPFVAGGLWFIYVEGGSRLFGWTA